jgi:prepilin peptidase CpaA
MMLARLPFIAAGFVLLAWLSDLIWASLAPTDSPYRNLGPLVVVSAGMILAAIIDGWAFKVPNWLTLSLVLSGWALGLLHDLGVGIDHGQGGIGSAILVTMVGFALLGWLLAIAGMGQGDVKMTMGFGSWIGAYFGGPETGIWVLFWAFALGAIVGGVFGLVMMMLRRKFKRNLSNFGEIITDMRMMMTQGPSAASQRSNQRRAVWDRLPYGIPLCVGFIGYLAYLYYSGDGRLLLPTG